MEASLRAKAERLAEEFADGHTTPEDLNAFIRLMMKTAVERMLDTEMDVHLGRRSVPAAAGATLAEGVPSPDSVGAAETLPKPRSNHRNGRSKKTVSGDLGWGTGTAIRRCPGL
jgi:putative transposase